MSMANPPPEGADASIRARMRSSQEREACRRQPGRDRGPSAIALLVGAVVCAVVVAGCGGPAGNPESDQAGQGEGGVETTGTAENGSGEDADSASAEGVVDVEGGYTQDEQLVEMKAVVEVMREHFGREVATIDGEAWSAELHNTEVAPRPEGDGVYRHKVRFDVAPEDLKEAYATAEEIADQLGLTENMNNSHGVTEHDKIFYGAGAAESRGFLIASTTSGDGYRAFYQTRLSDDPSLQDAYDRIVEKNSQEREVDGPLQTDVRKNVPGYEGE